MGDVIPGKQCFKFPGTQAFIRSDEPPESIAKRLRATQPGDLLLIRTPGILYEISRKLTRNLYDHVAVVLGGGRTVNIVNPKTVVLPVMVFARPGRRPLILRPVWPTPRQRDAFLTGMEQYIGGAYNLRKTAIGIVTIMLYGWLGLPISLKKPELSAANWICTEAILAELAGSMPEFGAIDRLKLDYNTIGFATTNDFLRICIDFPPLLRVVG